MKKIKEMFLNNYNDNCNPFENYVFKGTLYSGCYIPCNLTPLYPLAYLIAIMFPSKWIYILIIVTFIITLHRYYAYKMKRLSWLAITLTILCMYFLTIKPLSWGVIYIFPILYWSKNNIKCATFEIIQDIFYLSVIPYMIF